MKHNLKGKIKGSVILITGGTGSFGNTVIKKLLELNPAKIIIFSRDEEKQFNMRNSYNDPHLRFIIGDVRDKNSVQRAMIGVDYVFHAAALKQVPTCEFFPIEAVKTNIFGAQNVIEAAIANKVKKIIFLSTDKAVYPINAMGMSKALMEKVMVAASKNINENNNKQTILCGVRYGNVLFSRGSVLPYFIDLVRKNKALVVTNPLMTRFLLSLSEAVDLVLYAFDMGENGYLYVRKAPACTIETLAQAVCKIYNHKKGYKELGVRAGEKIHETLVSKEEMARVIDSGDYFIIPPESQGLDYNRYFYQGEKFDIGKIKPYTSENTTRLKVAETKKILLSVPEIQKDPRDKKNER